MEEKTNINEIVNVDITSAEGLQKMNDLVANIDYKALFEFVLDIALMVVVCALLFKLVNKLSARITNFLQNKNSDMLLVRFMPLITKFLKSFVVVVVVLSWVASLGVNVSAVLAGIGIGGLAVGFAAKETIADVFGTVVLIADKSAKVGDVIEVDKTIGSGSLFGIVEDINFRSTKIRAFDGPMNTIPNHILATSVIKNYTLANKRRIAEYVDIVYETPVEKVKEAIEICKNILADNSKIQKGFLVELNSLSSSSLKLFLRADTFTTAADEVEAIRTELLLAVFDSFNKAGIEFAYDTQTLYLKKEA